MNSSTSYSDTFGHLVVAGFIDYTMYVYVLKYITQLTSVRCIVNFSISYCGKSVHTLVAGLYRSRRGGNAYNYSTIYSDNLMGYSDHLTGYSDIVRI